MNIYNVYIASHKVNIATYTDKNAFCHDVKAQNALSKKQQLQVLRTSFTDFKWGNSLFSPVSILIKLRLALTWVYKYLLEKML